MLKINTKYKWSLDCQIQIQTVTITQVQYRFRLIIDSNFKYNTQLLFNRYAGQIQVKQNNHSYQYYKMEVDEFEHQSQSQDYVDYGPEGYHPVQLGQRFNNNSYTVVQKLGWGHFSTVWLAVNDKTKEYSALKIQRSKQSHTESALDQLQMLTQIRKHESDPQWLEFLKTIQNDNPKKINSKLCRPLLLTDNFVHYGIHGKHMCSMFQLMGPNLLDLIQHYEYKEKRMPLWLVKKITRDVLLGLVYLHQRCNIIHTDLKPENIMIKLEGYEEQQLIDQLLAYKVKPLSMKYLKNLQTSKNPKNKKKNEKKKLKKKKQQQAQNDQKQQEQQQSPEVNSSEIKVESVQPPAQHTQPSNNTSYNHSVIKQSSEIIQPKATEMAAEVKNQASQHQPVKSEDKPQQQKQLQEYEDIQDGVDMSVLVWKNVKIKLNNKLFFKIVDMGNACFANKHFSQDIQTREYRSPEVILGHQYSHNTDIFSLACVVFEMMTNNFLFKPKKLAGIRKDEDHLYQMLQTLGPMDKDFSLNGKNSADYFNKKGKLTNGSPKDIVPISRQLIQKYEYRVDVAVQAQQFLLPMLAYDPRNRFDARTCLKSKWLWE